MLVRSRDASSAYGHAVAAVEVATEALHDADGALAVRARTILATARRIRGTADARAEGSELVRCLHVLQATGYRSLEPQLRAELAALAREIGDEDEAAHQEAEIEKVRPG